MNKSILLFVLLLLSGNATAQCNDWEKLIAYDRVFIGDVAPDRFGNLYVAGWFDSDNLPLVERHYSAMALIQVEDLVSQICRYQ